MHRRELVHFSKNLCSLRLPAKRFPGKRLAGWLIVSLAPLALGPASTWAAEQQPATTATAAQISQISDLLDDAEAAERNGHLIYPARGSAMTLYYDVLFLQPDNPHAHEGLVRLAEYFLEDAQIALDRNQLLKADSLVSKARMIYPEYPAISTMQRKIDLLEHADRTRETLNWRLVADRSTTLNPRLRKLGGIAKSGDCRVTINVSNDAEGRWIYQQMNQAQGAGRVRAQVKIASPAAVDIICFNEVGSAS